MEHVDLILRLDKQQHHENPEAVKCPNDAEHGNLLSTRDGRALYCGKCDGVVPAVLVDGGRT